MFDEPMNDLSTFYQVDANDMDYIRDQRLSIGNLDTLVIHMGALTQIEWHPRLGNLVKQAGQTFIVGDDYRVVKREVERAKAGLARHNRGHRPVVGFMTALDLADDPRPPKVTGGRVWPIGTDDGA